jgi:GxxExxY protein
MIVPELSTNQLQELSDPEYPFNVKNITQLEGVLNGRVDLFFEYDGKFYILDWKSNFLGNDLEDYNAENIKFAMKENNYNLQYLIYTIALVKYLGTRKSDFVVEGKVLIEMKAISEITDVHYAQSLNYLKIYKLEVGLLINFGSKSLTFKRLVYTP